MRLKIYVIVITAAVLGLLYHAIEGEGLRLEIEGLWLKNNFRDVGSSLNRCLAEEAGITAPFNDQVFMRVNKWFSGWKCENVGEPDAIFTLNYNTRHRRKYYCTRPENGILEGIYSNTTFEFHDIEMPVTWENKEFESAICMTLYGIIRKIAEGNRVLVHCEAGRDRTGAVSALIATALTPRDVMPRDQLYDALECDYRKSPTLREHKYGRIRDFMFWVESNGSARDFLAERCAIQPQLIDQATQYFLNRQ